MQGVYQSQDSGNRNLDFVADFVENLVEIWPEKPVDFSKHRESQYQIIKASSSKL